MVKYNKVNVKLSDLQLNKVAGVTLRMNIKMFDIGKLLQELLLITTK